MSYNQLNNSEPDIAECLRTQLEEGYRLLDLKIRTRDELRQASDRRSMWIKNNVALLKDPRVPQPRNNRALYQMETLDKTDAGGDFESSLEIFRNATKSQLETLKGLLPYMPSPAPGKERVEAMPKSQSLKEKLESHPFGLAAIVCAASITLAGGAMSWYHGENEQTLENKYETKIEGMKNECDAQRRVSEAMIAKLREELAKASASKGK